MPCSWKKAKSGFSGKRELGSFIFMVFSDPPFLKLLTNEGFEILTNRKSIPMRLLIHLLDK